MAPTREIVRRRIGPSGLDVECDADEHMFIDIKETKKARYERGRGFGYQKTRYTLRVKEEEGRDRTYIDPPLHIENPENGEQFIDYQKGVLKKIRIAAGKGFSWQKTVIKFDNTAENENRKVRVQRIDGVGDDYIDVERIEKFKIFHGRGAVYQGKRVHLLNEEENIEAMEGPCKIEAEE